MLNLKLKNVDADNNRIYFTANETDGIYCLKEETSSGKRFFSLNRCLADGKPSHKLEIEVVGSIEAPRSSEPIVNSFFRGTL